MIRFYLILILFLISLLCIFKAPEYHLWLLAIGVTEFPLLFAGITMLAIATVFWAQRYQLAGTVLGLITLAVFLSPVVRSYWVAKKLPYDLEAAFGNKTSPNVIKASQPFSVARLFNIFNHCGAPVFPARLDSAGLVRGRIPLPAARQRAHGRAE